MDCLLKAKDGAETLIDYCAGTLTAPRAAELDQHIAACIECRRLVDAQRSVWNSLDEVVAPGFDASRFDQQLYARIAREDAAPWWQKAWRSLSQPAMPWDSWKPAVSLAAACALLAVGFLVRIPQTADVKDKARIEAVDMEQVEQALEDLEMLTPVAPAPTSAM
jgi:anti-sigma factor RsiW